ncbi:mechanosensitive ion channel family protein [Candidatus Peregrinibacteria bacterium]|jgi:MscS family membrane protein|nr:mechanosensitive ion channel family protein [Candidatus Peregrinibacteria bacterium]
MTEEPIIPNDLYIESFAGKLENYPWLAEQLFGNSVAHYLAILAVVALVYGVSKAITYFVEHYASKFAHRTKNALDDVILKTVHQSVTFILVLATMYLGIRTLNVPEIVHEYTAKAVFILFTLKIVKELENVFEFMIRNYLEPYARRQRGLVKTFVPPLLHFSRIILWVFAALLIASNLGYNINSLIAGLGVGGIAFALGAQQTLSNIFGSISLLVDQPFKIGDWIEVNDVSGTVLEIGLRSTKIETINMSIVSMPNETLAQATISNESRRNMFHVSHNLAFTYGTSLTKLRKVMKDIEAMLKRDKDIDRDTVRVRFLEFGDSSLQVNVFYYITDISTYSRIMEIKERINLKIKERAEKIGAEMAFPTQSLHLEYEHDKAKTRKRRKANK